jgi:hypothetical protein
VGRGGPTYKILKMALELEFLKRMPIGVAANEELDTVGGSTSSEAEKGAAHGAGAGDVEAPVSTTTDDEGHRN